MRIDLYMFEKGLVQSRTKAKQLISSGRVLVKGEKIEKCSYDISGEGQEIEILPIDTEEFVGRGGIKLQTAIDEFGICVDGKICVDIGSSTGGFTDCLLRKGASKVYAVDSGRGQLVKELLADDRVVSIEGFNARYMTKEAICGESAELVVMDVSFISQTLIYPAIKNIASSGADIVTLIKPQFEAGRTNIGKNGIVKDKKVHLSVIENIKNSAAMYGFKTVKVIDSPIKGGSGNSEYLIHLKNS